MPLVVTSQISWLIDLLIDWLIDWCQSVCELTQPADGAAVGLVAQRVCAGVAETQVSAGQNERVAHVRQAHYTLGAVVADLVVGHLQAGAQSKRSKRTREKSFSSLMQSDKEEQTGSSSDLLTFDSWLLYLFSMP